MRTCFSRVLLVAAQLLLCLKVQSAGADENEALSTRVSTKVSTKAHEVLSSKENEVLRSHRNEVLSRWKNEGLRSHRNEELRSRRNEVLSTKVHELLGIEDKEGLRSHQNGVLSTQEDAGLRNNQNQVLVSCGGCTFSRRPDGGLVREGSCSLDCEYVELSSSDITWLTDGVFDDMDECWGVNLEQNRLSHLPPGVFSGMPYISEIWLWHNNISSISGAFEGLDHLNVLDLWENNLDQESISGGALHNLPSLGTLYMGRNRLPTLKAGVLRGLGKLFTLELEECGLTSIEDGALEELGSLSRLWLAKNAIRKIGTNMLTGLGSLTELDMEYNRLEALQAGTLNHLESLQQLWMTHNDIGSIDIKALEGLRSLRLASLTDNAVSRISAGTFSDLESLEELWMSGCQIEVIERNAFLGLSSLEILALDNNQIRSVPFDSFFSMLALETLLLHDNYLGCVAGVAAGTELFNVTRCPSNCTEATFYVADRNVCIGCPYGTQLGGVGSISGANCVPCDHEEHLSGGSCQHCSICSKEEFESRACSPTADRECSACFPASTTCGWECLAGHYDNGLKCEPCPAGHYKALPGNAGQESCFACNNRPSNSQYSNATGLTSKDCPYVCDDGRTGDCDGGDSSFSTGVLVGILVGAVCLTASAVASFRWLSGCPVSKSGGGDTESSAGTERKPSKESHEQAILYENFPAHVADAMIAGEQLADDYSQCATVVFTDIAGFTELSCELEPEKVSFLLDDLFSKFDAIAQKHGVYKVETIGDCYIGCTNLIDNQPEDHAARIGNFSIEAQAAAADTLLDHSRPSKGPVRIRVGFDSGPVVGRIVGTTKKKYTIFGNTVNTASRMESTGVPGKIQCTQASADLMLEQDSSFNVEERGTIEVKGRGELATCFLNCASIPEEVDVPANPLSVEFSNSFKITRPASGVNPAQPMGMAGDSSCLEDRSSQAQAHPRGWDVHDPTEQPHRSDTLSLQSLHDAEQEPERREDTVAAQCQYSIVAAAPGSPSHQRELHDAEEPQQDKGWEKPGSEAGAVFSAGNELLSAAAANLENDRMKDEVAPAWELRAEEVEVSLTSPQGQRLRDSPTGCQEQD